MIPVEAIFASDRGLVGEVATGSDWILFYVRWHSLEPPVYLIADLCYLGDSIHVGCSPLKQA